jgi:hypothetical protein
MTRARKDGSDISSTAARAWGEFRMSEELDEWEELGFDDPYYRFLHVPCGREVMILMGHPRICPQCHAEKGLK